MAHRDVRERWCVEGVRVGVVVSYDLDIRPRGWTN
jgi:hypothetical protein